MVHETASRSSSTWRLCMCIVACSSSVTAAVSCTLGDADAPTPPHAALRSLPRHPAAGLSYESFWHILRRRWRWAGQCLVQAPPQGSHPDVGGLVCCGQQEREAVGAEGDREPIDALEVFEVGPPQPLSLIACAVLSVAAPQPTSGNDTDAITKSQQPCLVHVTID